MSTKPKSIKINMVLKMVEEAVTFIYPLVTSMYVIRTIGKDNYGEIQYVRSILSYFSLLAGLGISGYAAREGAKVRDNKVSFQQLSNEIFSISSLSTSVALLLLMTYIGLVHKSNSGAETILYLIGAASLGINVIGRGWINNVYEDFMYVTIRYLITSVITTILIFLLIHKESDYVLYFLLMNSISSILAVINYHHVNQYSHIGFAKTAEFKKHLTPIFMIFFSGIASTIYLNSDVTLLGILVSKEAVAIYSVAATLYTMVKQISNSVVSVTIPRLSYYTGAHSEGQFTALIEKMVDYVIVIVLPSTVGLSLINRQAMIFIGGGQYAEGGSTLIVLAFALPFAVLANILAQGILLPRNKERIFLVATIISATINIVLNFLLLPRLGHLGAALTTLLSEITMFCILLDEANKLVIIQIQTRTVVTAVIGCVPIIVICQIVKKLVIRQIPCLFIAVGLSVIVYILVLAARKHAMLDDIKDVLSGLLKRFA